VLLFLLNNNLPNLLLLSPFIMVVFLGVGGVASTFFVTGAATGLLAGACAEATGAVTVKKGRIEGLLFFFLRNLLFFLHP
jgi:hypothetical protein